MGVTYVLVNLDKKEQIAFLHINASKMRELADVSASASITTWYLLNNRGDRIAFLSDYESEYHLFGQVYHWSDFRNYKDVTDEIVEQLIKAEVLRDAGILWMDEDDNNSYVRDLRNTSDAREQKNN
jgi:hypothetical protein